MTKDPYPTKEDIAKILSETITFTGQVGVINIHHTVNRLHDMIHKKDEPEQKPIHNPKQLTLI